jgi:cell wall-associated NlpC family hydrolase
LLPHDVEEQYDQGTKVSRPGPSDLVFFKEHGIALTHVGIDTGKGMLVHASSRLGRVTEIAINYIKGYAGAKRLL